MTRHKPLAARLMARVDRIGECWIWTGGTQRGGYGRIARDFGNGSTTTHLASYEIHVGPIPDGLCVCHRCDVRNCINPDHLFLGTHQDNSDDKMRKGRDRKQRGAARVAMLKARGFVGDRNPAAKLCAGNARVIMMLARAGVVSLRAIGAPFGASEQTVWNIKHGHQWSCLTERTFPND